MLKVLRDPHKLVRSLYACRIIGVRGVSQLDASRLGVEDDDMPIEMENPYKDETKRCLLCGIQVDYKNVQLLSQFVSSFSGVPHSQKSSGLCEKKHTEVIKKIRLARASGYMAHRTKETTFLVDPVLTGRGRGRPWAGQERPIREHLRISGNKEDTNKKDVDPDLENEIEFDDIPDDVKTKSNRRKHGMSGVKLDDGA